MASCRFLFGCQEIFPVSPAICQDHFIQYNLLADLHKKNAPSKPNEARVSGEMDKGTSTMLQNKENNELPREKNSIKLSADIALASTRIAATSWSRATLANASSDASSKLLVEHILGPESSEKLKNNSSIIRMGMSSKRIRCKKILRKSCTNRRVKRGTTHVVEANLIAKRLVKKRTQVLKSLVPGGECMDDVSLIKETLDYILSLRVQVDVMRQLANATGKFDHSQSHI